MVTIFLTAVFTYSAIAQDNPTEQNDPTAEAEQFVKDLYTSVSFEPGKLPDWVIVKDMFIEDAIIILFSGREGYKFLSRDDFVKDFVDFITCYKIENVGFTERVHDIKTRVFGNMAYSIVLYDGVIPGRMQPQLGVDSFQLMKIDGKWKFVSITNEAVRPGVTIPEGLKVKV